MKSTRSLTIVVASPGDVKDERDSIKKVAEDLNNNIAGARSLHIDVVRWETDTYPGFHVDGPQAIIDKLLGIEDADILIGIFWIRFGTPTKDAKSGTEHEIRKAYEAWKRTHHPHIMLYFNKQPYYPKLGELDQLRQVLSFKEEISHEALYWEYDGIQQFTDCVRDHLTKFILNISDLPQQNAHIHTGTATRALPSPSVSIDKQIALWLKGQKKRRRWINTSEILLIIANFSKNTVLILILKTRSSHLLYNVGQKRAQISKCLRRQQSTSVSA